jgi:hypothetical protein
MKSTMLSSTEKESLAHRILEQKYRMKYPILHEISRAKSKFSKDSFLQSIEIIHQYMMYLIQNNRKFAEQTSTTRENAEIIQKF